MKLQFIMLFLAPDAKTGGANATDKKAETEPKAVPAVPAVPAKAVPAVPAVPAKAEPTSETLVKLRADRKAAWDEMRKIEDGDSKEAIDAKLKLFKLDGEIKAEIANIQKTEQDAKLAELRNQRVALASNYKAAILANTGKTATAETADAEKAAYETLVNELLAKFSHSAPAKTAANGDKPAGERGATSKAIIELFLANRAAGMTDTENKKAIIAAGHSRGTTGAVVLAWQRENGEVK